MRASRELCNRVENIGSTAGPLVHSSIRSSQNLIDSPTGTQVSDWVVAFMYNSTRSRNLFEYETGTRDCSPGVRREVLYIKDWHEDEYVSVRALMFK